MRGFFAFAITFSLLFLVWRTQFTFFRRYGLEDNTTVTLNAVLLFVILFFVYPLKFVFTAIMERVLAHAGFPDPSAPNIFKDEHAPLLMLTYALGWSAVFGVFALLHRHAYRQARGVAAHRCRGVRHTRGDHHARGGRRGRPRFSRRRISPCIASPRQSAMAIESALGMSVRSRRNAPLACAPQATRARPTTRDLVSIGAREAARHDSLGFRSCVCAVRACGQAACGKSATAVVAESPTAAARTRRRDAERRVRQTVSGQLARSSIDSSAPGWRRRSTPAANRPRSSSAASR